MGGGGGFGGYTHIRKSGTCRIDRDFMDACMIGFITNHPNFTSKKN